MKRHIDHLRQSSAIQWIGVSLVVFLAALGSCNPKAAVSALSGNQAHEEIATPAAHTDKSMKFSGENQVTLKLSFIGCACGPDYPQYHIDSVLATDNDNLDYYPNKEISLVFSDPQLEKKLKGPNCATRCIHYVLSGNFEHNGYGMHRLAVTKGEVVTDMQCCERNR